MSKVVLVLASAPVVEGATIKSIAQQHGVDVASIHVASSAALIANCTIQPVYDVAISISDSPSFHTAGYLAAVAKILKPGGTLQIQQPDLSELRANLPSWGLGSKAALPLKGKKQATAVPVAQQSAWKIAPDDAEDELLDDDELLTEADLQRPAAVSKPDDCEVGAGKKACANCSCGRAEAEAAGVKVQLTQEMLDNPQSSCGNCSLGDAFRCASCPYKGLPSFETGKKIQLPANFLTADA